MSFSDKFKSNLTSINEKTFADSSLAAFDFQYHNCSIYQEYCKYLKKGPNNVRGIYDIPFIPIEFFKYHSLKSTEWNETKIFKSSGTTKTGRSQHYVKDESYYQELSKTIFQYYFGEISDIKILAILPSYLEQGDSSLICMVDFLIKNAHMESGYFLERDINEALSKEGEKIIIGVSYALLDLSYTNLKANNTSIIETGGMKGRGKEITRYELHERLKDGFGVDEIWSEYGMTELFSQAYGTEGRLSFPSWAQCLIRDINDPFSYLPNGRSGGINVIDLANIDTCCFIETKDLGRSFNDYFEVIGRFDNSDIRGCNLLI